MSNCKKRVLHLEKLFEQLASKLAEHRSDISELITEILESDENKEPREGLFEDIESRHSEFRVKCRHCQKNNYVQYDTLTTLLEPINSDTETIEGACDAKYGEEPYPADWLK